MNTAKAHCRTDRKYSPFHMSLLTYVPNEDFALKHLYNIKNTEEILATLGWTREEIKEAKNHISIDVWPYIVRFHIPKWVPISGTALYKQTKSISRFISKKDFISALMERNSRQANSSFVEETNEWYILKHKGSKAQDHRLLLEHGNITCSCHAYNGISQAFNQDEYALKCLMKDPILAGQIPDKHVLSAWKYLKCHCMASYSWVWKKIQDAAIHYLNTDWDEVSDEEVFAAAERAKKDLFGGVF